KVPTTVAINEFFELAVEQFSAELVPEGIPHYRIHAYQPRRQMADGKKLDEFHIHQLSAGPQRQRIALAAHICRCAVSRIELGQTASGQNHGLGLKAN